MKILGRMTAARLISPIDQRFALWCFDQSGGDEVITLSAALVSAARVEGHACVHLDDAAGAPFPNPQPHPTELDLDLPVFPKLDDWRKALQASSIVSDGSRPAPLVLRGDRLYLYRYYIAEHNVAAFINKRLTAEPAPLDHDQIQVFRRLFKQHDINEPDWQAVAAVAATRGTFGIISGGPGTGKTTTVVRILTLLLQREPELRIMLAAPTGKAASRLSDSINGGIQELNVDDVLKQRIPREVKTLHRLLSYRPRGDRFFYNRRRPLPVDLVVVDEASMVDILLMENLIAALPDHARLLLIGDHNQLASVDTGFVLGDLTRAAQPDRRHGHAFGAHVYQITGTPIPVAEAAQTPPLRDAVVILQKSYRFNDQSGIGRLAGAVKVGDAPSVAALLQRGSYSDVVHMDPPDSVEAALSPIMSALIETLRADTPKQALEQFAKAQILCALRGGVWGVDNLNTAVERALHRLGLLPAGDGWYHGRPILITRNDPATGLYNGDVGLVFRTANGPKVFFEDGKDNPPRPLSPARLPAHETAWAMTVHKNQGSEFDTVLLFLAEPNHPLATRALLYTGITRAKKHLTLVAEQPAILGAVNAIERRGGGLESFLVR